MDAVATGMGDWARLRDALARVREAAGLSREDVGRRIGVHKQTVYTWESAEREPTARNLFAWCAALGVRLVDVAEDRG